MEKMVTLPKSVILGLMPYLEEGMQRSADAYGMAGHSASEQMGDDFERMMALKSLLSED